MVYQRMLLGIFFNQELFFYTAYTVIKNILFGFVHSLLSKSFITQYLWSDMYLHYPHSTNEIPAILSLIPASVVGFSVYCHQSLLQCDSVGLGAHLLPCSRTQCPFCGILRQTPVILNKDIARVFAVTDCR